MTYLKWFLASKTFWLNVVTLLLTLLQSADVIALLPTEWLLGLTAVVNLLTILLRVLGGAPLTLRRLQ